MRNYLENGFLREIRFLSVAVNVMTFPLLPILPAVDDVLFNFAESDGLSQVNQVAGARNQGLTAPNLI
ncbi:MAG: hypothetical protein EHM73_14300 [Chroococcales cyanobacterium metabat2.561]|uniref:Uncharacterized protein n=1 Tax=Microcystis aeruginosa Ma_SC_T_19800800_S464 TaxID=2486257 RepID=A0A552DMV0_MICAE|nr:MAG: hypothetical protein EHM73_14300 [Chroococcales cyanobacterium metabat2.561]TRU23522.1 MAG: hypothetical protein EWV81_15835 [Microcystis aeruginosa Ma_SC_T_19800800_S464]